MRFLKQEWTKHASLTIFVVTLPAIFHYSKWIHGLFAVYMPISLLFLHFRIIFSSSLRTHYQVIHYIHFHLWISANNIIAFDTNDTHISFRYSGSIRTLKSLAESVYKTLSVWALTKPPLNIWTYAHLNNKNHGNMCKRLLHIATKHVITGFHETISVWCVLYTEHGRTVKHVINTYKHLPIFPDSSFVYRFQARRKCRPQSHSMNKLLFHDGFWFKAHKLLVLFHCVNSKLIYDIMFFVNVEKRVYFACRLDLCMCVSLFLRIHKMCV